MRHLHDRSEFVQAAVARSLGRLEAVEAEEGLLQVASDTHDSESPVLYHALGALSELRSQAALPLLETQLHSRALKRRLWAARCAAKIGGQEGERLVRDAIRRADTLESLRLRWVLWTTLAT